MATKEKKLYQRLGLGIGCGLLVGLVGTGILFLLGVWLFSFLLGGMKLG